MQADHPRASHTRPRRPPPTVRNANKQGPISLIGPCRLRFRQEANPRAAKCRLSGAWPQLFHCARE